MRPRSRNMLTQLYELLTDTSFAIVVLIALAVASILGVVVVDQVPFRGDYARMAYPDRTGDPIVWLLIHVVPEQPFRCIFFRTLLALLSLSLLACTIKRWRHHWRRALTVLPPPAGIFDAPATRRWTTRMDPRHEELTGFLKKRFFAVRLRAGDDRLTLSATRFGVSELGSVITHVGLLLLIVGALVMASTGFSELVWMRPGDTVTIPQPGFQVTLEDFRIETTSAGRVSAYISSVALREDTTLVERTEIKVNKPLRHRGYSLYQSSYRQDPTKVHSIDVVLDLGSLGAGDGAGERGAGEEVPAQTPEGMPGRQAIPNRFLEPLTVTVPWGERIALPETPYAVAIDTFFADFRIGEEGPGLDSNEPRNPAALLRFYKGDSLAGRTWYFLLHPQMPVGTGPDLPMRIADYSPQLTAGLEVATHPGSGWVWAGFAFVSLGTVLVFLLRREQLWLRLRTVGSRREIALIHQGAAKQAPEFAREEWETQMTALGVQLVRWLEPDGDPPVRSSNRKA
ncbi:MAG: cytochrome c biogenesis protein ResB [Candidatus Eisenbacteria sp.]|nr:cytochrome c biogenesis protein ResB [Candidatus Eisenbacteria bacterium]